MVSLPLGVTWISGFSPLLRDKPDDNAVIPFERFIFSILIGFNIWQKLIKLKYNFLLDWKVLCFLSGFSIFRIVNYVAGTLFK